MNYQRGLFDLLQCRPERGYQGRWQLVDEAHGIGQQCWPAGWKLDSTGYGVESSKHQVLCPDPGVSDLIQERTLAGVRVSDQRYNGNLVSRALRSVQRSVPTYTLQLRLELLQPTSNQASVRLDLGLSRSSCSYASAEAFKVRPLSCKARQQILVLGELNLKASLPCPGSRSEHVEDQSGSVENLALSQRVLEVTLLCWGQLIITDDSIDFETMTCLAELSKFALTQIRMGRSIHALGDTTDNRRPRGPRQLRQLIQRFLRAQQGPLPLECYAY